MCQTASVNSVNSPARTGTFNDVVTVSDFLTNSALRNPDRVALIEAQTGERISYSALDSKASATAAALLESGLTPSRTGDRVAMLMGNSIEFVISYFGIVRAGLVPLPLNPGYTSREITEILEISQAKVWSQRSSRSWGQTRFRIPVQQCCARKSRPRAIRFGYF